MTRSRVDPLPSSEAEFVRRALEGPSSEAEIVFAGSRGIRMGRMLGFFESFPFLQIGKGPWAFVGPVALIGVCVFKSGLSTPIRVSLIVAPDENILYILFLLMTPSFSKLTIAAQLSDHIPRRVVVINV